MTVLNQENTVQAPANQEKVEQNVAQKVDTNVQQQPTSQLKEESKEPEKNEDPNWKAFREARKKDRAEREAAERRAAEKEQEAAALKAAMEAAFAKSGPSPAAYQQYYGMNEQPEETEEQKIDKRVNAILKQREQQYEKDAMERERQEFPNRVMRNFPDFNQVVSQENLDYLDFHFPEVSRPIHRLNDSYDKWVDMYQAIKKFIPNSTAAKKEAAKADINQNKPKSISSTGITQSGNAPLPTHQETEARRAANWERMKRIMNGVG
jgi:hypothetical protein